MQWSHYRVRLIHLCFASYGGCSLLPLVPLVIIHKLYQHDYRYHTDDRTTNERFDCCSTNGNKLAWPLWLCANNWYRLWPSLGVCMRAFRVHTLPSIAVSLSLPLARICLTQLLDNLTTLLLLKLSSLPLVDDYFYKSLVWELHYANYPPLNSLTLVPPPCNDKTKSSATIDECFKESASLLIVSGKRQATAVNKSRERKGQFTVDNWPIGTLLALCIESGKLSQCECRCIIKNCPADKLTRQTNDWIGWQSTASTSRQPTGKQMDKRERASAPSTVSGAIS